VTQFKDNLSTNNRSSTGSKPALFALCSNKKTSSLGIIKEEILANWS
jgi:hypothetical protein